VSEPIVPFTTMPCTEFQRAVVVAEPAAFATRTPKLCEPALTSTACS
jgi:hypothetical protein